jgi:hypothetical protein
MKVKLHSTKNKNITAAPSPVSVAASAPKFHPVAGAAGSENATMNEITITKLERFDYSQGDWHDAPLRYSVNGPGNECQKFSTKKNA